MSDLPDEVWVVKVDGRWPIYVATSEYHAMSLYKREIKDYQENYGAMESVAIQRVHLWRCRLEPITEYEMVYAEAYLKPKEDEVGQ